MDYGDRLRRLRNKADLSQEEVANRIGVGRSTYTRWELNENEPPFESLRQLAELYQTSVDHIISGDVTKNARASASLSDELPRATPEERDFADWVKDHISQTFFYDFDTAPEERKEQLIADIRYLYERDKKTSRK